MASISTTCCPNSFQLRLAFGCRKPPQVIARMRFRKLDRQFRVFRIAGDSEKNCNGVKQSHARNSWINSNSSTDDFSGWSADGGEKSVDSQRKQWLGGTIKAGIAGVILVAGLTFAALSISKRKTSKPAIELEPLTSQQEMSLISDEQNDKVEVDEKKGTDMTQDSACLESETGIDEDSSFNTESNNTENRLIDDTDVGNTLNDGDSIKNASNREDLQTKEVIGDMSVASDNSPGTAKLPAPNIAEDSFDASGLEYLEGNYIAENSESTTELKEFHNDTIVTDSDVSYGTPVNLNSEDQEGVPGSRDTENYSVSLDPSSNSFEHVHSESLVPNISVISEVGSVLESQIELKENQETGNSQSSKGDLDPSKTRESSTEANMSSLEELNINGSGLRETTSVSAVINPFVNELDTTDHNDITGSRSYLKPKSPWNSFSSVGIPAPSVVSAALQVLPGKVLVPAAVDQVQGQALAALQVLKVIEADVKPGDLCTRREYARWLVSASSSLSRNTVSKVYPAMYIENVTELAFDDITSEDPDFPSIQGLAEAGLISSKLSRRDLGSSSDEDQTSLCFYPDSSLSRQDLVTWKMSLEKRQLPEADRKMVHQLSGFIDIDKINPDAWPALVADLSAGEQGIIALSFGYTRLFQPDKPVTKAQAAVALATGEASDVVGEELARIEAESLAENAVAAHSALVAQVEKDVNETFEEELLLERVKIDAVEKLAEEARQELEIIRAKREEDNIALMKERASVESEMEVLSRLRRDVEEQLQSLLSNKVEISYEKERIGKLRKEAEIENEEISRLQYELEVERKALSMARSWAEDEAKRAREQAKALEVARDRWERHGIKVVIDNDLQQEETNAGGVTWVNAGEQFSVEGTVGRAETLMDKLRAMAADVRGKSRVVIDTIIKKILELVSNLKEWASKVGTRAGELKDTAMSKAGELKDTAVSKAGGTLHALQQTSAELTCAVKEGTKRVAGDCKEGVEKITQKFKT